MIQQKHLYLILGFIIGYIVGSTSFLLIAVLLGVASFSYLQSQTGSKVELLSFLNLNKSKKIIKNLLQIEVKDPSETNKITAWIDEDVLANMEDYCKWKGETVDSFCAKAASLIFMKDRDWVAYQRTQKKTS